MDVGWWLLVLVLLLLQFSFLFQFISLFFGFSVDLHKWNRTKRVHCRTDAKPKVDKLALNEIRFAHDQSNCNNDGRRSKAKGNIVMKNSFVTAAVCIVHCLYMGNIVCAILIVFGYSVFVSGFLFGFSLHFFLFVFFLQINRMKWCIEKPMEENATKIQPFNTNTCAKCALSLFFLQFTRAHEATKTKHYRSNCFIRTRCYVIPIGHHKVMIKHFENL